MLSALFGRKDKGTVISSNGTVVFNGNVVRGNVTNGDISGGNISISSSQEEIEIDNKGGEPFDLEFNGKKYDDCINVKIIIDGVEHIEVISRERYSQAIGGSPFEVKIDGSVGRVRTTNAPVDIAGDAGDIDTTNGSVRVRGNSGDVDTNNGNISISGDAKSAKTTNGDIRATNINGNCETRNGDIEAETITGDCRSTSGRVNGR